MALELPFPVSVNQWVRVVGGRPVLSKRYREWQHNASQELLIQRPQKHQGPVAVEITLGLPDRRRRDIDNLAKPLLDLLTKFQVIEDDSASIVRRLTLSVAEGFEFIGARIEVTPI